MPVNSGLNSIRFKVNDFCRSHGICTACYSRKAKTGGTQCQQCLDRKKGQKARARLRGDNSDRKYYLKNREDKKAYAREYRAKLKRESDIEKAVRQYKNL